MDLHSCCVEAQKSLLGSKRSGALSLMLLRLQLLLLFHQFLLLLLLLLLLLGSLVTSRRSCSKQSLQLKQD